MASAATRYALAFHHLGVACERIDTEAQTWSLLGYQQEDAIFVDVGQGIRGMFMVGPGPRVELLEPTEGSATLAPWLKRRIKLYHSGYFVTAFDDAFAWLRDSGATVAREPIQSVYFGTRIAFLMMPNLVLLEIIEAPDRASPSGAR